MKRMKFIMLALVVALVLMGAGYAAWTQVFTIGSTVNAGELFVQVANTSNNADVYQSDGTYAAANATNSPKLNIAGLVQSTSETAKGSTATTLSTLKFNLSEIYPGTRLTSVVTFNNMGTVAVKTAGTGVIINAGNALWQDIVISFNGTKVTLNGTTQAANEKILADALANIVGVVQPGETKTVTVVQELPITSTDVTEKLNLGWTVNLNFDQYNK